jgi:hypothetical protein
MNYSEYLEPVHENTWYFPVVDRCPNPPSGWIAAAWETKAVQETFADSIAEDVSKCGELLFARTEEFLALLSAALGIEQVVRLFHTIRDRSPHRESEFRRQFEQGFTRHAAALPPPLTRRELVAKFKDDLMVVELLGEEAPGQNQGPVGYSYRLVAAKAFSSGWPQDQGNAEEGQQFLILHGAEYALSRVFSQRGDPLRFAVAGEYASHGSYDALPDADPRFSAWVAPRPFNRWRRP